MRDEIEVEAWFLEQNCLQLDTSAQENFDTRIFTWCWPQVDIMPISIAWAMCTEG